MLMQYYYFSHCAQKRSLSRLPIPEIDVVVDRARDATREIGEDKSLMHGR